MRKTAAIAALLLVLGTAGCAARSPEDAYLSTVRDAAPVLKDVPDSELTGLGKDVCGMFDQQGFATGMPAFVKQADSAGISAEGAGLIAGAAVAAFCPEYGDNF